MLSLLRPLHTCTYLGNSGVQLFLPSLDFPRRPCIPRARHYILDNGHPICSICESNKAVLRKSLPWFKLHRAGAEDPCAELVGKRESLASFQSLTSGRTGTWENGEHRCVCVCVCMRCGGVESMSTAVLTCEGVCRGWRLPLWRLHHWWVWLLEIWSLSEAARPQDLHVSALKR